MPVLFQYHFQHHSWLWRLSYAGSIPTLPFALQTTASWIHSREESSSKCTVRQTALSSSCVIAAPLLPVSSKYWDKDHRLIFKNSTSSIKNFSSLSKANKFNSSLNHLRELSSSTHVRVELSNCYTILCHVLLSFFFRSSTWQVPHIQERWEVKMLFTLEFCGILSLIILLRWSFASLQEVYLQSHRLAVLVMPPSLAPAHSPLLAGAGSPRQGKNNFFPPAEAGGTTAWAAAEPLQRETHALVSMDCETLRTALSHLSSLASKQGQHQSCMTEIFMCETSYISI